MTPATESENIQEINRRFESAFARGNAADLASLYTSQASLMPPGSEILTGPSSIQQFWQQVMHMGIKEARLSTTDLEIHDSTAIEVGRYRLKGLNGQEVDQGKYVVVWKKESEQWKLHRDIWNTSNPGT